MVPQCSTKHPWAMLLPRSPEGTTDIVGWGGASALQWPCHQFTLLFVQDLFFTSLFVVQAFNWGVLIVESVPCFKELEHHRTGLDLYEHILFSSRCPGPLQFSVQSLHSSNGAKAYARSAPLGPFDPDSTSGAWAMIKS